MPCETNGPQHSVVFNTYHNLKKWINKPNTKNTTISEAEKLAKYLEEHVIC